jgi:hypothetical protein
MEVTHETVIVFFPGAGARCLHGTGIGAGLQPADAVSHCAQQEHALPAELEG